MGNSQDKLGAGQLGRGPGAGGAEDLKSSAPLSFREKLGLAAVTLLYSLILVVMIGLGGIAFAQPQTNPHPYRGYAQICIQLEPSERAECGIFATEELFDDKAVCEAALRRELEALRREFLRVYPQGQIGGRYECAFDRSAYSS